MKRSTGYAFVTLLAVGLVWLIAIPRVGADVSRPGADMQRPGADGTRGSERSSCSREGDAALYADFGEESRDIEPGKTVQWSVAPGNFGFVSATCTETDTFCLHAFDTRGWTIVGDPPLGSCSVLAPGYIWWQDIYLTAPCEVDICAYDTLIIVMAYCGEHENCNPACRDTPGCEDPNFFEGTPYYSADTVVLHVVESSPALLIMQDSLSYVAFSQSQNYVPFTICNGDPCAGSYAYEYTITNTGWIGGPFEQSGVTEPLAGGACEEVYAVVDASVAEVCDMDSLTIIAWDRSTGTAYDTCVQIIHCLPVMPVPLATPLAVSALAAAAVIIASVTLRRRARGSRTAG